VFNTAKVIETDRLLLRPPVLEDFEGLARLLADPNVAKSLSTNGRPRNRFEAWQSFAGQVGHWQLRGFGMFVVFERATGAFVGRVGPWFPEGWPGLEVGWSLISDYWGRGYGQAWSFISTPCCSNAPSCFDSSPCSATLFVVERQAVRHRCRG
jgi:RimJ/RimL family protein N-acetyltransferase